MRGHDAIRQTQVSPRYIRLCPAADMQAMFDNVWRGCTTIGDNVELHYINERLSIENTQFGFSS